MGQVLKNFGRLYHKYVVAISFPVISFCLIYADWSHTQKWKKSLQPKEGLQHWATMTDSKANLEKIAKMKSQYRKPLPLRAQYLLCVIPFACCYLGYKLELIENVRDRPATEISQSCMLYQAILHSSHHGDKYTAKTSNFSQNLKRKKAEFSLLNNQQCFSIKVNNKMIFVD